MLVSVLLLNYKQAQYVPQCLNSLARQTYSPFEIIFTDNASGDGSVEFVRANFPQARVVSNTQNLFFSRAHNRRFAWLKGNWCCYSMWTSGCSLTIWSKWWLPCDSIACGNGIWQIAADGKRYGTYKT